MKKFQLVLACVCIIQSSSIAQTFDATWANRFQTVLDSTVIASNIKGASVAVFVPGRGTWKGVSGISSPATPITDDMRFGIGSNTKLFIAVMMLKLQEQGILSLDDHLYQWLPSFPYVDSTTTIRQLLSHQSGIFDYINDNASLWNDSIWADTTHFWTSQDLLATIGAPHFAPGHGFSYSNTNYILAAMIIESATGTTWIQKLHDIILDPLNMDSTFVGAFEPPNGPVAHEWDPVHGELVNSPMTSEYSTASSAGAILSTGNEMAQWYSALFSGTIIADSSLQEVINFEPTSFYGLGLFEGSYFNGIDNLFYSHSGGVLGYISFMHYDVRTKSVICILTNGGTNPGAIAPALILEVFYNEYPREQNDAGIVSIENPRANSCDASVTPSVVLTNFGVNVLTQVTINYQIDTEIPNTFNWTGNLAQDNSASVTLPATATTNGTHSFKSYTSLPNGSTEGYFYNDTSASKYIINIEAAAGDPINESFEGAVFPSLGWIKNPGAMSHWDQTPLGSFTGNFSIANNNYSDPNVGAVYDLEMPVVDISGISDPVLEFAYAYTYYPGFFDSLRVMISPDCGVTWQNLFYKGGNALKTAPVTTSLFYPDEDEWKQEIISLAAFTGEVLIRFRDINRYGNNLFVDDVSLNQSTAVNDMTIAEQGITVYPNPANEIITIEGLPVNSKMQVSDLAGNILFTEIARSPIVTINIDRLSKGVFLLTTEKGMKKFVKL